jgi:hypothetical protein
MQTTFGFYWPVAILKLEYFSNVYYFVMDINSSPLREIPEIDDFSAWERLFDPSSPLRDGAD